MRVNEIDDVLVARMASGRQTAASSPKTLCLIESFSATAYNPVVISRGCAAERGWRTSMTRSTSWISLSFETARMRDRASLASSEEILDFETSFSSSLSAHRH